MLSACSLERGQLGFVTTNTLVEGDTLEVGMEQVTASPSVRGRSPHPWPTKSASLQIVEFWASSAQALQGLPPTGSMERKFLQSALISNRTDVSEVAHSDSARTTDIAFQGSVVLGLGFTLTEDQKDELIAQRSSAMLKLFSHM